MITYQELKQKVLSVPYVVKALPPDDTEYILNEVKKLPKNSTILEIGTFTAGTTRLIAESAPTAKVYSTDINVWDPRHSYNLFNFIKTKYELDEVNGEIIKMIQRCNTEHLNNVTLMTGSSLDVKDPEYIDFLYLDGDHSYEMVLAELRYLYPKIKYNGIIMGDDIQSQDVYDAVRTFSIETDLEYSIYNKTFKMRKPHVNLINHHTKRAERKLGNNESREFLLPKRKQVV